MLKINAVLKKRKFLKIKRKGDWAYYAVSLITVILTLLSSFTYKKAVSTTEDGNINLTIKERINSHRHRDLQFGIINTPSSGSVDVLLKAIDDDVIDSCPTDATCYGTPLRGQIDIIAEPSSTVTLVYTNGTLSDGTNTIDLDMEDALISQPTSVEIEVDGENREELGGILTISSTLPVGTYSTENTGGVRPTITIAY